MKNKLLSLLFVCVVLASICAVNAQGQGGPEPAVKSGIRSATLFMDVIGSKSNDSAIFLNGAEIGKIPVSGDVLLKSARVQIPENSLGSIATTNSISIENRSRDLFKISNVYLEVRDLSGNTMKSDMFEQEISSYETGNFGVGWSYNGPSRYLGKPLPVFSLVLPPDKLGYIKQAVFHYTNTVAVQIGKGKEWWKRVQEAALPDTKQRTMLDPPPHVIAQLPREYILAQLERYNAGTILLSDEGFRPDLVSKMQWLRERGYETGMLVYPKSSKVRIPGLKEHEAFMELAKRATKNSDIVCADEWFLSPSITRTQGGNITNLDPEFVDAFKKYSGYSDEDVVWAFKNWTSSDPRALKAWEFCEKVQADLTREFVKVARQSNPKVKICISYITHNWNKFVTSIDKSVQDFDQILDCQTYWYGRASDDSLNAPTLTAPIGIGKIEETEYPGKFLWMGIDPGYTGKKTPESEINSWWKKYYHNSAVEAVPYLAILYASADGVFIQNPFLSHVPDKGTTDEFADMVRLVSSLVPRVKPYVKSDVAYYYDPQATWEVTRRENSWWGRRQTDQISVGFIQQFCDVDVTRDVKNYKNVITAGGLQPKAFDYEKQNIYMLGAPAFNEKGEKVGEPEMTAKIGLKDFRMIGDKYFPADDTRYYENGCTNYFSIAGDVQAARDLGHGWAILDADLPLRTLCYESNKEMKYTIASQNKRGNVRVNSMWPSFTRQDTMRKVFKSDMDYFGLTQRDCPQVNGTKDIVAVAFREPRTAIVDFGNTVQYKKVKLVVFNGSDGIIRNETTEYRKRMPVDLPPLSVMVAHGLD